MIRGKNVWVAGIRYGDGTDRKVLDALGKANISAVIVLSLGAGGLYVGEKDREQALRILKADARKHGYWITFGDTQESEDGQNL